MKYLASPYSHDDPAVRLQRFEAACRAAAILLRNGVLVFSPIAHTHPIALAGDLPLDWAFWQRFDREMIAACDEVIVLCLDGWASSRGVQAELAIAEEFGIPVSKVLLEALEEAQVFLGALKATGDLRLED
jgi:nucleoside 2-deoxyribosyltransferase